MTKKSKVIKPGSKKKKPTAAQIEKEQKIIDLVYAYKREEEGVAEALLSYYNNLFNAYLALLCRGDYRINSRSVQSFVKLFMANKYARTQTTKYKIHDEFHNAVNHIRYCMHDLEEKDIEHELKAIFLKLAKNWEQRENIVFTGYISGCFHLYVKDWAKYHMTIAYKGRDREDMDAVVNSLFDQESNPEESLISGELDADWIRGLSCSWPWSLLTTDEREDIKFLEHDRMSRENFAALRCYEKLSEVSDRRRYLRDKIKKISEERNA